MGDGQVWRLPLALDRLPRLRGPGGALAPYPGLVSIGTDATGRVLVDLEAAHGRDRGHRPRRHGRRRRCPRIAVELATNRWSDQMQLTLVGFGADLAVLAPDRVTRWRP